MDDLISRRMAIEQVLAGKLSDDSFVECVEECNSMIEWAVDVLKNLPSAQPTQNERVNSNNPLDCISRQAAIDELMAWEEDSFWDDECRKHRGEPYWVAPSDVIERLPSAQPDPEKYEYHYDHTDCIWYRPEARNRCPVTCAQYRDGWNDAMNYIFRDGKGYMPYRRDKQYEG